MNYLQYIESYQDFPKKDVLFWDFTGLLRTPEAFSAAVADMAAHFSGSGITHIAAIEAKGFVLAGALAHRWGKPLVLVRKPGLIPGKVTREDFIKEYGTGTYELKEDTFKKGDRVLVVYDILAAPGATEAAIRLVERQGAEVAGCAYVIELEYLHGREPLQKYDVFSLVRIKDKK